mmetsp:Transcript_29594/g.47653  ORF Transcript_29594/g.47653 Transcript_29594/m.47653 type:complete len:400 (+) Transcript_29594:140-1339(+)
MNSLDAAITAQLTSLKANMGNPQLPPRPGMLLPGGFPGLLTGLSAPAAMTALAGTLPQALPTAMPQMPQMPGSLTPSTPIMSIAVNDLPFVYQLQEADLRETCQRWGTLQTVSVYRDGGREVGVVVFADAIDAADCQRQLNNAPCTFDGVAGGAQGVLSVVLGSPEQLAPPMPKMLHGTAPTPEVAPMGVFPPQGMPPMALQGALAKGADALKGKGKMDMFPPQLNGKGAPAVSFPPWSCKVIVHAERLHPEFPIVEKIVGVNGMNAEHIRSQANCQVEVRGARSGTIDSRTGQELPEPMFVWLASEAPEAGAAALEMVRDLLGSVYDEHGQWCTQHNLQWNQSIEPTIVENPHLQEGPPLGQGPPPSQELPPGDYGSFKGKGDKSQDGGYGKGPYFQG